MLGHPRREETFKENMQAAAVVFNCTAANVPFEAEIRDSNKRQMRPWKGTKVNLKLPKLQDLSCLICSGLATSGESMSWRSTGDHCSYLEAAGLGKNKPER